MVKTASTMLPLGSPAPDFALPDPTGEVYRLADFADAPALAVMFICNHCPFVQHIRPELAWIAREYQQRGVAFVAINANDPEAHPEDRLDMMGLEILRHGYSFPYLFDATQEVAKAFHAACTPDFFLFDRDRRLVYRGQFDSARPGKSVPVTGVDLRRAIEALLTGKPVPAEQLPSIGCNIKWRPGQEPEYFAVSAA